MSNSHRSQIRPERENYTLRLVDSYKEGDPVVVEAVLTRKSRYRWDRTKPNDPRYNLSLMLGNDNGIFKWGRASFEQSGRNFRLEQNATTQAIILHGELLNIQGEFKDATANLDEGLQVEEYVDTASHETFHRLSARHDTPPERTLVLCFDGTSNHFSNQASIHFPFGEALTHTTRKNTNVVKLVELLKKNDPSRQMVYYQTGVGTYAPPGLTTSIGLSIAEKADEGAAWYLYQHVIDGYKFLMESHKVGDSICLFGFSRGAFTARALAGMLHCVGLLPRHNRGMYSLLLFSVNHSATTPENVPFAYEVYKNAQDNSNSDQDSTTAGTATTGSRPKDVDPEEFKQTFCTPVKVDFVGVWDTVASVGALFPKTLPWIEYNPSILTFRQALALDERRGNFIPSVWDHNQTRPDEQDVREVWFKGEHTDVGGGSARPTTETDQNGTTRTNYTMLSNIPLRWMIRQIIECKTGILFDYSSVERYRDNNILEKVPSTASAGVWDWVNRVKESIKLDHNDISHPIIDSIGLSPLWNILEYMPVSKPTKTEKFESTNTRWPNAKSGRSIYRVPLKDPKGPQAPIFIHSSVVTYLASQDPGAAKENYKPRAKWYGYGETDMPSIEDVERADETPRAQITLFPETAKQKLDIVRPTKPGGGFSFFSR